MGRSIRAVHMLDDQLNGPRSLQCPEVLKQEIRHVAKWLTVRRADQGPGVVAVCPV